VSQHDPPGGYPYEPYGAEYGERPPPHYGHGYGHPPPPGPNVGAIVSLVLNLLAIVSCCNILGIPGAILAGLALRAGTGPGTARSLVIWSWVLLGTGFVLAIGTFLFLGLNGYLDD
jgi:hypothetical protein